MRNRVERRKKKKASTTSRVDSESFLALLLSIEIYGLLLSVITDEETPTALAHVMRNVVPKGASRLQLGDHSYMSDLTLGHSQALMPGLVVEWARPQKSRRRKDLAYDYMVRSEGRISNWTRTGSGVSETWQGCHDLAPACRAGDASGWPAPPDPT